MAPEPTNGYSRERRRYPTVVNQELTTSMRAAGEIFGKMQVHLRAHKVDLPDDAVVLELGVGKGKLLKFIHQKSPHPVVGVDSNPRLSKKDQELLGPMVYEAPIENLPFEDRTFDVITGVGVFDLGTYNQNQPKMIAEIARVLKPGGIFYPGVWDPEPAKQEVRQALEGNFWLRNPMDIRNSNKIYVKK